MVVSSTTNLASKKRNGHFPNLPSFSLPSYEPRPLGPMDVEIKISHCGVCGSDIHTIDSGWSRWMGTHCEFSRQMFSTTLVSKCLS